MGHKWYIIIRPYFFFYMADSLHSLGNKSGHPRCNNAINNEFRVKMNRRKTKNLEAHATSSTSVNN